MKKLPRSIKKEPARLLTKGLNSLTLAMELFNRPFDMGRSDSVLILLDHSFEMLLKAGILQMGSRIRDPGERNTIGFQACVDRARSNAECQFLKEEDAIVLITINALRDAAQHHLADVSEEQLYLHMRSGMTLFRDLVDKVFNVDLGLYLPRRVLPISTVPFTGIEALFDRQIAEIQKLVSPGRRRRREATAILRPLAIMDRAIQGEDGQSTDLELSRMVDWIKKGEDWRMIFAGANSIECVPGGSDYTISLRITKKDGIPIQIVPPDSVQGGAMALKRVDELAFYNLSPTRMAKHLGITGPKFYALQKHLQLETDPEYFKLVKIDKSQYKRYSQKALDYARQCSSGLSEDEWSTIWSTHRPNNRRTAANASRTF